MTAAIAVSKYCGKLRLCMGGTGIFCVGGHLLMPMQLALYLPLYLEMNAYFYFIHAYRYR